MTVLITGAARGIGAAIAEKFASRGFAVAINYLTSKNAAAALAERLAATYGVKARIYRADVSNWEEAGALVENVCSDFGDLGVLVNNAGISEFSLLLDTQREQFDKMLSINAGGVFCCSKAAVAKMLAKGGSIVNISSIWGVRGAAMEAHYSASKAAVISLTQSLAKEYASAGIRINAVAAGATQTDMLSSLSEEEKAVLIEKTPLGRLARPDDIAEAAYFLASEKAAYITGQTLIVDGGFLL